MRTKMMKKISRFIFLFAMLLLLVFPVEAEYQRIEKPPPQCWHYNCWTYADGSISCDWEVEVCDGRFAEFPAY